MNFGEGGENGEIGECGENGEIGEKSGLLDMLNAHGQKERKSLRIHI